MKKYLFLLITMLCASAVYAQKDCVELDKKYRIEVTKMDSIATDSIREKVNASQGKERAFFPLLVAAYKSSAIQKTVNAVSNVLTVGVNYLVGLTTQKRSWLQAVNARNTFKDKLDSYDKIADFYSSNSTDGALDPSNLQFDGFTFTSLYTVKKDSKKDGKGPKAKEDKDDGGNDRLQLNNRKGKNDDAHCLQDNKNVSTDNPEQNRGGLKNEKEAKSDSTHNAFHIVCKLRKDPLGISHIANHSKFYLTVDTLIIYPQFCDLPNDSASKEPRTLSGNESFFLKRKDLSLELNVKVYSSWINEAIMLQKDQLLGEFKISAIVNKDNLITDERNESVFVYTSSGTWLGKQLNTQKLVSIEGESFVVPRSYIGASGQPTWGTGQYRLEFELFEHCNINNDYYLEPVGNGEAVADDVIGNKENQKGRKWSKIWKQEWHEMKKIKPSDSFLKNIAKAVKTAYLGENGNWITEVSSPVKTVMEVKTSKWLQDFLKFDSEEFSKETSGASGGVSKDGTDKGNIKGTDGDNGGGNSPTDGVKQEGGPK